MAEQLITTDARPVRLRRELGLGSAAAAVAGEAIAVGIFLTPAGMAKLLGSPFWLLFVWLLMGAISISGALCFGELAARYPEAGGLYVYLREAFGERVAFLYGWMSMLVMDPGVSAALAVGMATYASFIFGWSTTVAKLFAIASIAAICGLNMINTRASAGFLRYITWLKFAILALLVIWALVFRLGSWSHFVPFVAQRSGSTPLLPALGGALVAAFYSFGGWWDVSKIAGEVKDPARTLPRALVLGVVGVVAAYVLVSGVFLYLVPLGSVTNDQTFVAQAGAILFGRTGANLLAGAVIVCVLGSLAALFMLCPRVYYAMARHGVFIHSVAELHPVFATPMRAIGIQGIMASLLVALGAFDQIIAYFIFVAVLFIGLTVSTVFVFRRRERGAAPTIRTPGYPFTPLAFLGMVLLLLTLMMLRSPRQALLGCAVVLLGIPVYALIQRRREAMSATPEAILNHALDRQ
ncbi:MAG TPA: amino acid permease [Candidatus Limnocylindrales bacterium]|jgi:APA family basic amino acid/polyamine antiporter|nr:amino acid permease [Candidatus Limnocylindrales bacterium]